MITLKAIQNSTPPTNPSFLHPRRILNRKKPTLSFCNSNDTESEPSHPEGDKRKQELLAKIAMLHTQKIRLTDYLDERSAYLTQFAEEANAEFDQIAENALKGLDEAGDRIMENLDNRIQSFEETVESNREEIEMNDIKLAEFEDQIETDRNEGLFFKSFKKKGPEEQVDAKEETQKLRKLTRDSAGSKIRRNIYLALIVLLVVSIVNAIISSAELDWRKIGFLGLILVGLLAQYFYEQRMSLSSEKTEGKEE
ncbi:8-amino-7-oxononanoate synthase [Tasmannia lanceolata]|uniref:8-amino-7-oxononanoate synthase n=1 Tax=Tasmannia lanceolata TaxID=3420 RepID=UPI004063C66F